MAKLSILALVAFVAVVAAEPPVGYAYSQPAPILLLGGGHSGGFSLGGGGGHSGGFSLGGGGGHSGGFSLGGGGGGHSLGGGISLGGGGGYSHGGGGGGGGGTYRAVHSGYQTSEGQYVDPHLLEEIKHILLKDEVQNSQFQSSHGSISSGHGLSGSYGAPAAVYGVPHYQEHVVGIELGHVKQGIQVAQYEQDGGYAGGYAGGYSSGGYIGGGGHGGSLGGGFSSGSFSSGGHGSLGGDIGSLGHGSISLSSGYSAPSGGGYNTIAIPAGSYGVPLPSSRYGSPHH